MRKFDNEISFAGTEKEHNFILYGHEEKYVPFNLKYLPDIQLLCVKNLMQIFANRGSEYVIYAFALNAVSDGFFPLLDICLDYSKAKCKSHEVSKYILKRLNGEWDIIDGIESQIDDVKNSIDNETLKDQLESEKWGLDLLHEVTAGNREQNLRKQDLFTKLDMCNHTYYIKDIVPTEMNPIIEKYIKMIYEVLEIDTEPVIVPSKNQPSGKEEELAKKGVTCRDNVLVLRNIHFYDVLDGSILLEIAEEKIPYTPRCIVLDNCCFDIQHFGFGPLTDRDFYFHNCHFKQGFNWMGQKDLSRIVLDNCVISDSLTFNFNDLSELCINDCVFENTSDLKVECFSEDDTYRVKITDSVFYGAFEVTKCHNLHLTMNNVTFYKPFTLNNERFSSLTEISNLCFPSNATDEMEASKKQLYDKLVSSNLKEMAEDLNLLANAKPKKPAFDYAAYQAEYDTGWLQSKNAAYLLGRKDTYLSKKRMADKKKITRTTIPYRGDGKNIQYPVDALLAFKAQDWNKLKELRKKYNYSIK